MDIEEWGSFHKRGMGTQNSLRYTLIRTAGVYFVPKELTEQSLFTITEIPQKNEESKVNMRNRQYDCAMVSIDFSMSILRR